MSLFLAAMGILFGGSLIALVARRSALATLAAAGAGAELPGLHLCRQCGADGLESLGHGIRGKLR